ncbi:APC family permease [Aliiglaciecola sp. CAU 1673]|uniref:APC family permease n=1 Tax=Aliiglaciecola sp. CAU 1673 TaxID=3032595 RepID=UPI0023DBCA83|nr:APC family permease [Aliiglaciecola sp. CAU 1673]MDF2180250.1 APC family permease [Aliiglaciecola sp. CAU 1673]
MQDEKLPRSLGAWSLWLLVVNGLIGAGIFGLPSGAAALAGPWSPWVYLFCSLLILPILLCFAELASYFRGSGGPIRYANEAFGPFWGFQAGWLYYVARMVSFAANSVLLVDSIAWFVEGANQGVLRSLLLTLIIGCMTLVNVLGAVQSIRSLAGFTVLKFAVLILLVAAGLVLMGDSITPLPSASIENWDLGAATLLLIYAFVGFESVLVPAGESKNPARDMPRALIWGLLGVTLLYMLIQWVSLAVVPGVAQSKTPLLDVASTLLGPVGASILMLGVLASVGGNLLGALFSTPRTTYALALEKSLPDWFARVHPRYLTPSNSIWLFGILALLMALFGSFMWLAAATVLSRLLMYMLSVAALPKLRARHAKSGVSEGFVLPGGYLFMVLAFAACLWLMWQVSLGSLMMTSAAVMVGTLLFFAASRRNGQ